MQSISRHTSESVTAIHRILQKQKNIYSYFGKYVFLVIKRIRKKPASRKLNFRRVGQE